ncbi:MAG: DNA replication/repair protein RecF [Gammaproteobacteria bacterium]|nr:DNA replication/repair protein RecF [Gammaproteobacteria bacterium]
MSIVRLDIINVRNIRSQTIYPSQRFNFIYGQNASGKSALIEAIHILGRAKSFRTSTIRSVIRFDQEHLIVSGQIQHQDGANLQLGIQLDGKDVEIRINQQRSVKRSDLAYGLPLQIIHPKSFELLDASAQIRREFMDWGIFNDDPRFLAEWRKYKKALNQRNTLLKLKAVEQLDVWNNELVKYGTIVNTYREQYIQKLKPILSATLTRFINLQNIDIRLISGWDSSIGLEHSMKADFEKDLRDGFTHSGPHRDDFLLTINAKIARDIVSRGQLKLLMICLKLAQVELLFNENGISSCILLDDLAAELDNEKRSNVLMFLNNLNCQVFITATEKQKFGDLVNIENFKMFHVEHGEIKPDDVPRGT